MAEHIPAALLARQECRITGPDFVVGDVEWHCRKHGVDAVLRDPARYGAPDIRRADFVCPEVSS